MCVTFKLSTMNGKPCLGHWDSRITFSKKDRGLSCNERQNGCTSPNTPTPLKSVEGSWLCQARKIWSWSCNCAWLPSAVTWKPTDCQWGPYSDGQQVPASLRYRTLSRYVWISSLLSKGPVHRRKWDLVEQIYSANEMVTLSHGDERFLLQDQFLWKRCRLQQLAEQRQPAKLGLLHSL